HFSDDAAATACTLSSALAEARETIKLNSLTLLSLTGNKFITQSLSILGVTRSATCEKRISDTARVTAIIKAHIYKGKFVSGKPDFRQRITRFVRQLKDPTLISCLI
ncbi:hypothetical protein, partial [Cronobacter malonaticus]|uniref:hypothetical protein n=1 Tax=Cronobacter malonaticus TaxID=413503 RepID=UPI001F2D1D47